MLLLPEASLYTEQLGINKKNNLPSIWKKRENQFL